MDLIAGGGISILCSLLLWLFLPRGVVLTSEEMRPQWRVKNESALPVRILRASINGVATFNETTGKFDDVDVSDEEGRLMLGDGFGDPPETRGYILQPGETLSAYVDLNQVLAIHYRRAGCSGLLERRKLALRVSGRSEGVEQRPVELLCQLGCGICCLDVVLEAGPDAV